MIEWVNDVIFCENKNMFHKTKGGCVTVVDCSHGHFHHWIATRRWFMPAEGDLIFSDAQKCIDIYEIPGFLASSVVY